MLKRVVPKLFFSRQGAGMAWTECQKNLLATLAARAIFVSLFLFQKQLIFDFWQEIITLTSPICRRV